MSNPHRGRKAVRPEPNADRFAPVGLSMADLAREAERFGVSDEQVRRDHAISHVLAAIAEQCADDVIFFGGTALSRSRG